MEKTGLRLGFRVFPSPNRELIFGEIQTFFFRQFHFSMAKPIFSIIKKTVLKKQIQIFPLSCLHSYIHQNK